MKWSFGAKPGTDKRAVPGESAEMPAWPGHAALVAGIMTLASPALADRPTFADLLSRAEAQAAAGHRWSPHGDNMTETVEAMMDLIPSATPKQLAELAALLNNDMSRVTSEAPGSAPAAQALLNRAAGPPPDRPVSTAPSAAPDPSGATAPSTVPDRPALKPGPRAAELFARGQAAEQAGDVSGARRFYASAADQGSATAARDLGRLYDPAYLQRTALGGIDPDPTLARHWYERALAMGDAEAAPLLEALALR
jgi:TPR repeat protein